MQLFRNCFWAGRTRAILLCVAVIGGFATVSLLQAASLQESLQALGLRQIPNGVAAPEFRLPDLEGAMASLQEHRGKVVMLYFWSTW